MTAAAPGEPLKARLRREATWAAGESFVDELDTALYWISHLNEVEFGEEAGAGLDKQRVHNSDRGKVQVIYVPATRDGGAVTRQALRQLLRRLERSGDFGLEQEVQELSQTLQEDRGWQGVVRVLRTLVDDTGISSSLHRRKSFVHRLAKRDLPMMKASQRVTQHFTGLDAVTALAQFGNLGILAKEQARDINSLCERLAKFRYGLVEELKNAR